MEVTGLPLTLALSSHIWLGEVDEDQTPETLVPILRQAQWNCRHLPPLACSLLQIDSQMETSCQISFEFVDQELLVSYGCSRNPWAHMYALTCVGVCGQEKS